MSDVRVERAARVLCRVANPGMDPDMPVHSGVPLQVVLPRGAVGYLTPAGPAEPLWRHYVHVADGMIAAMDAPGG
jgi:hypothetical protein